MPNGFLAGGMMMSYNQSPLPHSFVHVTSCQCSSNIVDMKTHNTILTIMIVNCMCFSYICDYYCLIATQKPAANNAYCELLVSLSTRRHSETTPML